MLCVIFDTVELSGDRSTMWSGGLNLLKGAIAKFLPVKITKTFLCQRLIVTTQRKTVRGGTNQEVRGEQGSLDPPLRCISS